MGKTIKVDELMKDETEMKKYGRAAKLKFIMSQINIGCFPSVREINLQFASCLAI